MKIIRQELTNKADQERKPFAVVGETGVIIREFLRMEDAYEWLEWTREHD